MHIYRQKPWEALIKDCCVHSKQVALIKQIRIFTFKVKRTRSTSFWYPAFGSQVGVGWSPDSQMYWIAVATRKVERNQPDGPQVCPALISTPLSPPLLPYLISACSQCQWTGTIKEFKKHKSAEECKWLKNQEIKGSLWLTSFVSILFSF